MTGQLFFQLRTKLAKTQRSIIKSPNPQTQQTDLKKKKTSKKNERQQKNTPFRDALQHDFKEKVIKMCIVMSNIWKCNTDF